VPGIRKNPSIHLARGVRRRRGQRCGRQSSVSVLRRVPGWTVGRQTSTHREAFWRTSISVVFESVALNEGCLTAGSGSTGVYDAEFI